MFDNLPALSAPSAMELRDELEQYLSADPEQVGGNSSKDVITWWYERRGGLSLSPSHGAELSDNTWYVVIVLYLLIVNY